MLYKLKCHILGSRVRICLEELDFRGKGLGFRAQDHGLGSRVYGLRFTVKVVHNLRCRIWGRKVRRTVEQGLGSRIEGLGSRIDGGCRTS